MLPATSTRSIPAGTGRRTSVLGLEGGPLPLPLADEPGVLRLLGEVPALLVRPQPLDPLPLRLDPPPQHPLPLPDRVSGQRGRGQEDGDRRGGHDRGQQAPATQAPSASAIPAATATMIFSGRLISRSSRRWAASQSAGIGSRGGGAGRRGGGPGSGQGVATPTQVEPLIGIKRGQGAASATRAPGRPAGRGSRAGTHLAERDQPAPPGSLTASTNSPGPSDSRAPAEYLWPGCRPFAGLPAPRPRRPASPGPKL